MTEMKYLAIGEENRHFGLISKEAMHQWNNLNKYIFDKWKTSNDNERYLLIKYRGCLDKMGNVLLQAKRIQKFHNGLVSFGKANADQINLLDSANVDQINPFGMLAGDNAISDFEALLFQSRATLDRYAYLIGNLVDDRNSSYKNLSNVLNNTGDKIKNAEELDIIIKIANVWTDGLLVNKDGGGALRDSAGHSISLTEIISNCFSFTKTEKGVIFFDCKVGKFLLFESTMKAVEFIPYIILNSLSVLANLETYPLEKYKSNFVNNTISFFKFAVYEPINSPPGEGIMSIVRRTNPDGFELITKNMKKEIYDYAI